MVDDMEKLKKLGFKKIKTEPGFHMYELNPAELGARQRIHDNLKAEEKESRSAERPGDTKSFGRHREASSQISSKPQASSLRRYVADTKSKK
jgi:hypothetical protein